MNVLSLIQPWATLWVCGIKGNETRSWATKYRGRLLVHASASKPAYARDSYEIIIETGNEVLCGHSLELLNKLPKFDELPRGGIVGVVNLIDVLKTGEVWPNEMEFACGNYAPGRFAWKADEGGELDFFPCKGKLGIWQL
jgi:hypothetical protein